MGASNISHGQSRLCVIWALFLIYASSLIQDSSFGKGLDKNASQWEKQVGVQEWRQKQPKIRQGPFILSVPFPEFPSPHAQDAFFCNGDFFFNNGKERISYMGQTFETVWWKREGERTSSWQWAPQITSLFHLSMLWIFSLKVNSRSSLCEICHRNHQLLHIMMGL